MKPAQTEKLRAWWSHRQGLDGRLAGASAADVLAQTGWARSVGGVGPYLTLLARAGTSREAADAGVATLEISTRGRNELQTWGEIDKLCDSGPVPRPSANSSGFPR
jgi:hypothetical protein